MPLPAATCQTVLDYCDAHLPTADTMFNFIDDPELQKRLEDELYAARYIYKLGEALSVSKDRLHAHVKFQIVQYAAIYEAIIVHMLWKVYPNHSAVTSIEFHGTFKKAVNLPASLSLTLAGSDEEVILCTEARQRTSKVSIKFDDKVDAAVSIGFIDKDLGEEIKGFYKLRNAIHLESAIKNQISYEIDSSMLAFRRLQPFTRGIRGFLSTGVLPQEGRLKPRQDLPSAPETDASV